MRYHELSECTLNDNERFREKNEIIKLLKTLDLTNLSENEFGFVERMDHAPRISVKQLFWLRDIKDKCL